MKWESESRIKVEELINKLKSQSGESRCRAAKALGESGDVGSIEPLIHALKDKNRNVRKSAAEALGKIGSPRAVESLIDILKDRYSSVRNKVIEALGEIGDTMAVEPLVHFFNNNEEKEAIKALEKICSKIPVMDSSIICGKCSHRFKRHEIEILRYDSNINLFKISYYACRNCHTNSYLIKGIEKVVLLMDQNFEEGCVQGHRTLTVNWFKKKEPFDFDEIRINDANDFEVEELVMRLRNDMDKKRRKRLANISVYISPFLKLSPSKMNLLNDNFKIVKWIKKKK